MHASIWFQLVILQNMNGFGLQYTRFLMIVHMVLIYIGFVYSMYWCKRSVAWDDWWMRFCWDCLILVYLQGSFYRVVWTCYVILTIFIGVHCTLCNDDIQLYTYPKALETQTLPIAATTVDVQLDNIYMSMRLSSSLPTGVDAIVCHIEEVAYDYSCFNRSGIYSHCM